MLCSQPVRRCSCTVAVVTVSLIVGLLCGVTLLGDTELAKVIAVTVAAGLVALSLWAPRVALALYLVLFLVGDYNEELSCAITAFGAAFVAYRLVAVHNRWWSWAGVVALWALGSRSIFGWSDPSGYATLGLSIATGALAGAVLGRESRELQQQEEKARLETTRVLHDSVASTLTSVVMRAEMLSAEPGLTKAQREDAALIAQESRAAIQEVRTILAYIQDRAAAAADAAPSCTVRELVTAFGQRLESHGFHLEVHITEPAQFMSPAPQELGPVFTELAANIIKYATPGARVSLTCSAHRGRRRIRVVNPIGELAPAEYMTSQMGLGDMELEMADAGGNMRAAVEGTDWVTELEY